MCDAILNFNLLYSLRTHFLKVNFGYVVPYRILHLPKNPSPPIHALSPLP